MKSMARIFKLLTFVAALLMAQAALAQTTYTYTGSHFCGPITQGGVAGTQSCFNDPAPGNTLTSYTATDHVTATLTLTAPLGANLYYSDVKSLAGFQLTMNDGQQTLNNTMTTYVWAKVSTDGNGQIIGPWFVDVSLNNGLGTKISTDNDAPEFYITVEDSGFLRCCDPTVQGDLASNSGPAGTWSSGPPPAQQQVASLLTVVQGMQIPKQGTSFTDQLQKIETDISTQNGLACQDLKLFVNHVKSQTGKTITATQSAQLLAAAANIAATLKC